MRRNKKKENKSPLLTYIVAIAILGFILHFLSNSSINIRQGSMSSSGPVNRHIPSELNWFDSFKGISNETSKKKKEEEKKNLINFK